MDSVTDEVLFEGTAARGGSYPLKDDKVKLRNFSYPKTVLYRVFDYNVPPDEEPILRIYLDGTG